MRASTATLPLLLIVHSALLISPVDSLAGQPFGLDNVDDLRMHSIRGALLKMQVVQDSEFFAETGGSLKQMYKKCANDVEVAPSSIVGAGMGLFAKRNIKAGTIVSFFPCHGLGVDFEDYGSSICVALDPTDQDFFLGEGKTCNYLHYLLGSRPLLSDNVAQVFQGDSLFIDVNPGRQYIPGWLAHICNDGAIVHSNSEAGVLDYYHASRKAKNCVNIPFGPSPILATVTTKKVKKGEELLTSYGCSFWLEEIVEEGEESTDITETIQAQVLETTKDLIAAMQSVRSTYSKEEMILQSAFASINVDK